MKKIVVLCLVFGFAIATQAQIRKIPAAVTEAFKARYPNAVNVEWKDKVSNFTADFEVDGIKSEAKFNSKGTWQETEFRIDTASIPAEVLDGFKKSKYSDYEIKSARRIDLPKDKVQYRIEVEKTDINKRVLVFNSEGRLLKNNYSL